MLKKLFLLFITVVFLAACSGLGGEPEIVATVAPQVIVPPDTPDAARGAQIFAARCTECHGIDGSGNGTLVQSGQVPEPGNFRDPFTARSQTPVQWYATITNGRIENLMPPWRESLTEQERWDVALYTYTMAYTEAQLRLGEELFANCLSCHDGSDPNAPDLLDQAEMVSLSDDTIYRTIQAGRTESMHSFASSFSDEEIQAVVAYTRSLTMDNENFDLEATPEATAPESTTLDIRGEVINGTDGAGVPSDLTVGLRVFDFNLTPLETLSLDVPLGENNSFVFEDVVIRGDQLYLTTVTYQGRNFASGFAQGDTTLTELAMPITIYEVTTESSVVQIAAMVSQVTVVGDTIEVQFVTRFINTSDRVYVGDETLPDGRASVLKIPLPPGAIVIAYDEQERYYTPEGEPVVIDTRPLIPGEDRFNQLVYILQYGGGAVVEYPTEYAVNGPVRVLVQPDTITLTGDLFPPRGEEALGSITFQGYGTEEPLVLEAGDVLRYELSGEASEAAIVGDTPTTNTDSIVPLLIGAGGVMLILVGIAIFLTTRRPSNDTRINQLVTEIAQLDQQHDSGQINHDVYQRRRAELKAELAALMDKNK